MANLVFGKLHQFTEMSGRMDLPVHQYLLAAEPSVMFATGTSMQADWILPEIDRILEGRPLKYLVISHMESDECGGYARFQKKYPRITILCSSFTAGELRGFGAKGNILVCDESTVVSDGELKLRFVKYPSEVHLQDGILCYEENSGIFYSSDLMLHRVSGGAKSVDASWKEEVSTIDSLAFVDDIRKNRLKSDLSGLKPSFVATGHGSCIRCID